MKSSIANPYIPEEVLEALGFETTTGRIRKLEAQLAALTADKPDEAEAVRQKLDRGQPVSRRETAVFLRISTKKLQRMENADALARCPGLGMVVRYSARDVLRLASASAPKGA